MKKNSEKCHLLMSATTFIAKKIKGTEIVNSETEKLVGVTVDKLNFNNNLQKTKKLIKKFIF